jgi:hypothetical protein
MEFIKKTILMAMTTGATAPCSYRDPKTGILITGCTAMTKYLIPNTGVSYYIKFSLIQNAQDIGFFDAYVLNNPFSFIQLSGATTAITAQNFIKFKRVLSGGTTLAASGLAISGNSGFITGTDEYWSGGTLIIPTHNYIITGTSEYWSGGTWVSLISNAIHVVTGSSSSRLSELRKYVVSGTTAQKYVTGGTLITDGVDLAQTTASKIVYFLGAPDATIRYVDILTGITSGTTFNFTATGTSSNLNFICLPIYKNPNKENIISNPKIYNDVFIIRQEISAFDKNYRLEYIGSLIDLVTYAGGSFFNIVNNT